MPGAAGDVFSRSQLPETLREHCAVCNALIAEGRIRVVGLAPYERYYTEDGEFLGWGFDRGLRAGDPEDPHVGTSDERSDAGSEPRPETNKRAEEGG